MATPAPAPPAAPVPAGGPEPAGRPVPFAAAAAAFVTLAAVGWAYADVFAALARRWDADPQYSHGWLVPLIAAGVLWVRRGMLAEVSPRPAWWGLAILAAGLGLRWYAVRVFAEWFEHLSLVVVALGVAATVGGRGGLRWAWPACLFLTFMLPLPYRLEVAAREPLRSAATAGSTYLLQTVGIPAFAEGNVIRAGEDVRIDVVEACSGLRMLMVFFSLTTAAALFSSGRPLWQRGLMVASAVPIAIAANVARIAATGLLYYAGRGEGAELLHDHAEILMVPLALALLGAFLWVLDRVVVPADS